jgi:hypothetical protein
MAWASAVYAGGGREALARLWEREAKAWASAVCAGGGREALARHRDCEARRRASAVCAQVVLEAGWGSTGRGVRRGREGQAQERRAG